MRQYYNTLAKKVWFLHQKKSRKLSSIDFLKGYLCHITQEIVAGQSCAGYWFQGIEFEKVKVSKAQLSSVMPFLQYELPPRKSGNASGRVQHNFTLLLFDHLFY